MTWNHPWAAVNPQTHLQPVVFIEEFTWQIKRMPTAAVLLEFDNGAPARYFKPNK